MTQFDDNGFNLVAVSILSSLVLFGALQAVGLWYTGGIFEYPLDDVYIHLAMAEQIGAGGYGVNAGEYASAASSPLYPLLLLPVGSPEIQRYLPLFWNTLGLVISTWLWAKILIEAGYGRMRLRPAGYALAIFGPAAYLAVTNAYIGMEHVLHGAASLAIILGLFRHLNGNGGRVLLLTGIFLAPLFRLEGLGLALLATGVLALTGARATAFLAGLLVALPALGFAGFLMGLGLDPVPGSVLAKISQGGQGDLNLLEKLISQFRNNIASTGGLILGIMAAAVLFLARGSDEGKISGRQILGVVVFLAAMMHLFFGRMGWVNRYEHYILAVVCAGFVMLLPAAMARASRFLVNLAALVPFAALLVVYTPNLTEYIAINPRVIHTQQAQMAVFARDHLKTPVAVNDLGRVAWGNPNYVLDLWGLASADARKIRLSNPAPGWADPLARAKDVPVAMIYDKWLGEAVGENWVRVGELILTERRGFLGSDRVAFYATAPEYVAQLQAALGDWVPTLHKLTFFDYAEGME